MIIWLKKAFACHKFEFTSESPRQIKRYKSKLRRLTFQKQNSNTKTFQNYRVTRQVEQHLYFGEFPGLWADTVASYCSSRLSQVKKSI